MGLNGNVKKINIIINVLYLCVTHPCIAPLLIDKKIKMFLYVKYSFSRFLKIFHFDSFSLLSQSVYPPLLLPFLLPPMITNPTFTPLSLYENDLYHFVAFYGISQKKKMI